MHYQTEVLEVSCSKGVEIFLLLASKSIPVTLFKDGDVCFLDKFIDVAATRSLKKWRIYLDFVKVFCHAPDAFIFNVAKRDRFKIPKEYWQVVKIFILRGWEIEYVGHQPVLAVPPEVFCAKERQLLLHAP